MIQLSKENNMAQTSVEWLIEQLSSKHIGFEMYVNANKDIIEQAKEKHNEEIMDAFQAGKWDWSTHIDHGKNSMDPAEYYNETFKK